jgi:hypothetical protein
MNARLVSSFLLRRGVDLDLGPVTSIDRRLGAWNPASRVSDDLFRNNLA